MKLPFDRKKWYLYPLLALFAALLIRELSFLAGHWR